MSLMLDTDLFSPLAPFDHGYARGQLGHDVTLVSTWLLFVHLDVSVGGSAKRLTTGSRYLST